MINLFKIIALIILISFSEFASGKTTYFNPKLGFDDFILNTTESNGTLEITNKSNKNIFNYIDYDLKENEECFFEIRMRNFNNLEGKKYEYYDGNKLYKISNTSCGIFWNYIDDNNLYLLEIKSNNSCLFDFTDERSTSIAIYRIVQGVKKEIESKTLNKGINLYDGYNTIRLELSNNEASLFIGEKRTTFIKTIPSKVCGRVGYFTGRAARTNVIRAKFSVNDNKQYELSSVYDKEYLDNLFKTSKDNLEGYWDYLDMDLQSKHLKLGGKYTIALVKSKTGYQILYVSGSKVNKNIWQPFMHKGKLRPTNFVNTYDLEWINASLETMNNETYAQIKDNAILELHFPIYKSKIRFYKRNRPQNILQPIK